jgi:hypothetical protein
MLHSKLCDRIKKYLLQSGNNREGAHLLEPDTLHANLRYKIDARGLDYDEKFYWIFRSSKEILKEYKQCFDIDESRECDQATLLEYRKQSTKGFPITNFTFSNSKEKDLFDQLYAKAFSLESIICQKYDDFECTFTAARTLRIGLTFSFSGNYYGKQIAYKDTNTANLFRIKREMISHKLKKSNKLRNNQYFLVSGFVTLIQRGCINCRNCIWFNTDSSYSKWKLQITKPIRANSNLRLFYQDNEDELECKYCKEAIPINNSITSEPDGDAESDAGSDGGSEADSQAGSEDNFVLHRRVITSIEYT